MKHPLFSLMPIGGVGEIGSNMVLVRTAGGDVVIDCGLLFPYESFFDINYLIPDFTFLDPTRLLGVVITHGHEDHIGALTHFIGRFPGTKIYASPFTQTLIRRKCEEKNLFPSFVTYGEEDVLDFGELFIHPIHVTHSIPETFGLFLSDRGSHWGAFYVSDFKFDLTPLHEKPFNVLKLQALARTCKHTAYFIDSTNALVPGKTTSENDLLPDLEAILARPEKRVFVTLFASNVHRIAALCRLAKENGRKIVLMGRSIEHYVKAGIEHGHIRDLTEDELCTPIQVKDESSRMLVIVSGCQGDYMSALRRLAAGEDSCFKLSPLDLVVFSSKVIPGNEKQVGRIMNAITEAGTEIVTAYDARIHASGHPGREDIHQLITYFVPTAYFPIHGESFFLKRHADWIKSIHPKLETGVIYNWTEVQFYPDRWKTIEHSGQEPLLIHGRGLEIERTQISQRRKLACQGSVFISLDRQRGIIQSSSLGLPLFATDLLPKLEQLLLERVREDLGRRQSEFAKDQLRITVRQFFNKELGYKPVTEVHLLN